MAHPKRLIEDDTHTDRSSIKRSRRHQHCSDNHPPEFWDSLSKVFLTRRALRELDRRNSIDSPSRFQASTNRSSTGGCRPLTRGAARALESHTAQLVDGREQDRWFSQRSGLLTRRAARVFALRLAQFATSGEQDLSDLRGFLAARGLATTMDPESSSKSFQTGTQTAKAPPCKRSSAYDLNFEQHYINNGIYPPFFDHGGSTYQKPGNLAQIKAAIVEPRALLSPKSITPAEFQSFNERNNTPSEGTIMRTVIPMIASEQDIPNAGNIPFTNFTSMTNETTVKPVPDFFDGAPSKNLDKKVRDNLNTKIIPTKHQAVPVVPNFFLEAKAPSGGLDIARRQAMADGAYGARAMYSLQSYSVDEPVYDGNAYAYSSTYHSGFLTLYSHHLSAPRSSGEGPGYHMTQLRAFAMTDSSESYRDSRAAFRNLRDFAKQQRDDAITQANSRAPQSG